MGLQGMKHKILIADDDATLREYVKLFLEKNGLEVDLAESGEKAIALISAQPRRYSVVVLDFQMPGQNGAQTTEQILAINPRIRVLIYSGQSSKDAFYLSHRSGAAGLLDKNEGSSVFLAEVKKVCLMAEDMIPVGEIETDEEAKAKIASIGLVGSSRAMVGIADRVQRLKDKRGPVLILGESGTGKELIAKALHGDRKGPFKAVNCAHFGMTKGTARAELFGYAKGSFTGADKDTPGIFEEAGDGTLFLDEVYSLPAEAQVGLLRALQEKVVTRVGSTKEIKINCRIIAAAKPDLRREIAEKQFTEDLYQRLSQNIIEIPALRERLDDLPSLIDHFCLQWSKENGDSRTFVMSALTRLNQYGWPGNVRELENVIFSTLNATDKSTISASDLGKRIQSSNPAGATTKSNISLKDQLAAMEKQMLIELVGSSKTLREAAQKVGVTKQSLLRLLGKYGLSSKSLIGSIEDGDVASNLP